MSDLKKKKKKKKNHLLFPKSKFKNLFCFIFFIRIVFFFEKRLLHAKWHEAAERKTKETKKLCTKEKRIYKHW